MSGLANWEDAVSDPVSALLEAGEHAPLLTRLLAVSVVPQAAMVELEFQSPLELRANGYPTERVLLRVDRVARLSVPTTHPLRDQRAWCHRNGAPEHDPLGGSLCLWYPRDPVHLQWTWAQGLAPYLQLVHRHLLWEEFWRRTGRWPAPDAPHGERADGVPHPLTAQSRRAA